MASRKSTQGVAKKKKSRREQYKYPALENSVNLLTRKDEIEDIQSYAKDLPDEVIEVTLSDGTKKMMNPKEWMNAFTEEFVCANMQHKGPKIHKKKKDKAVCYDRNNARNRCIYTQEKAQNRLKHIDKNEDLDKEVIIELEKPKKKSKS